MVLIYRSPVQVLNQRKFKLSIISTLILLICFTVVSSRHISLKKSVQRGRRINEEGQLRSTADGGREGYEDHLRSNLRQAFNQFHKLGVNDEFISNKNRFRIPGSMRRHDYDEHHQDIQFHSSSLIPGEEEEEESSLSDEDDLLLEQSLVPYEDLIYDEILEDPHNSQDRYKSTTNPQDPKKPVPIMSNENDKWNYSLANSYFDNPYSLSQLNKMECVTPTRSIGYCSTFRACVPTLFNDQGDLEAPALAELVSMSIGYCTSIKKDENIFMKRIGMGQRFLTVANRIICCPGSPPSIPGDISDEEASAEKLNELKTSPNSNSSIPLLQDEEKDKEVFLKTKPNIDDDGKIKKKKPLHSSPLQVSTDLKGEFVEDSMETEAEVWHSEEEIMLQKKRPANIIPIESLIPREKLKEINRFTKTKVQMKPSQPEKEDEVMSTSTISNNNSNNDELMEDGKIIPDELYSGISITSTNAPEELTTLMIPEEEEMMQNENSSSSSASTASSSPVIKISPEPVIGANGKFTLDKGVQIVENQQVGNNLRPPPNPANQIQIGQTTVNIIMSETTVESNTVELVNNNKKVNEKNEPEEDLQNLATSDDNDLVPSTTPMVINLNDVNNNGTTDSPSLETTLPTLPPETLVQTIVPHQDVEVQPEDDENLFNVPVTTQESLQDDNSGGQTTVALPLPCQSDNQNAKPADPSNSHGIRLPLLQDKQGHTPLPPPLHQLFLQDAATSSPQNEDGVKENGNISHGSEQEKNHQMEQAESAAASLLMRMPQKVPKPTSETEFGGLGPSSFLGNHNPNQSPPEYQVLSACTTQDYYRPVELDGTTKHYPYLATIVGGSRPFCSGTLITEKHILTASHFLSNITVPDVFNMRIHVGYKSPFGSQLEGPFAIRKVIKVIRHKGFSFEKLMNDIAILVLDQPIPFSDDVHPICLSNTPHPQLLYSSNSFEAYETGWVEDPILKKISPHHPFIDPHVLKYFSFGYNNVTWALQEGQTRLKTTEDCQASYDFLEKDGIRITNAMLCASTEDGKSCSFKGNSGAPLFIQKDGKPQQIGIVSWGLSCGHFPAVYTGVANYLPWIEKVVQRTR